MSRTEIDLEAMQAPTDSESGNAPHNPDVWELRSRITALVEEVERLRTALGWYDGKVVLNPGPRVAQEALGLDPEGSPSSG